MAGFYLFNAFEAQQGKALRNAEETTLPSPPASVPSISDDEEKRYGALSQAAEYVVYGRVNKILEQTRGVITPEKTSFSIPVTYDNYLIDVIQWVSARGGKSAQSDIPPTITLRQISTSNAPQFVAGETFIAFLKRETVTGTYYVVGLTAGPLEGKLSVTVKDGQLRTRSGKAVADFLQGVRKTQ